MAKTTNLGLNLTEDKNTNFADWQSSIDGNNGSNKSNMQIIDEFAGAIYGVSGTVTLNSSGWQNGAYALTLADLGANDAVFFSPVAAADKAALESANVIISASGSTVTFTAKTAPTANIALNYFISRGKA